MCTQHLKGFNYTDVLLLPVYERRFFINLLTRDINKRDERSGEQQSTVSNGKGSRTKTVSGDGLKNKFKNGEIPLS